MFVEGVSGARGTVAYDIVSDPFQTERKDQGKEGRKEGAQRARMAGSETIVAAAAYQY